MTNKNGKLLFFFLLLNINFILTGQNDIISFNLNSFKDSNINRNISTIIDSIKRSYIYANIKIGEPEYILECKFSLHTPHFAMLYNEQKLNEDEKNKNYHIKKSKTFKNITCLNQFYVQTNKDIHANEQFKMDLFSIDNKQNKEIIINNLDFVLGVKYHIKKNYTEVYYLSIGLQIFTTNKYIQRNQFNFITNLKNINLIDDYIWFMYYKKEEKEKEELKKLDDIFNINQKLLIGDYPHNYKPNEFSKEQLYNIYTNNFLWSLKFKSIYFYENRTKFNSGIIKQGLYNSNCQINFNDFFIYAPYTYLITIKNNFFNDYINQNICHAFMDNDLETFYCDKSNNFNINNLKEFPTLYFEHNEFNYTFEFTYRDLFIESNDNYIFLIVNTNDDVEDWFLGRAFFLKYQFFFNPDAKSIGFYNPNIKFNKNNDNKNEIIKNENNFKFIILIIVLSSLLIISIVALIFFFKNYKNKKKKRANELDDDFDYTSDKNIINN